MFFNFAFVTILIFLEYNYSYIIFSKKWSQILVNKRFSLINLAQFFDLAKSQEWHNFLRIVQAAQ